MTGSSIDLKDDLRACMLARRNGMPAAKREAADASICKNVCNLPQFKSANVVFAYLSFGTEVQTRGIIERAWEAGKVVALPRCTGPHQMRWFRVTSLEGLEKSALGVDEPPLDEATEQAIDDKESMVAIVPGLAFDAQGFRLGYGGGFYDAFLAGFAGASIGLCRSVQLVESLKALGAVDAHDVPVERVVTE